MGGGEPPASALLILMTWRSHWHGRATFSLKRGVSCNCAILHISNPVHHDGRENCADVRHRFLFIRWPPRKARQRSLRGSEELYTSPTRVHTFLQKPVPCA